MSALSAAASKEDGDTIKNLQARVADLEAQLYAVGAGGVGKMEQPQVEQEPVGCITGTYGGYPVVRLINPALVLPFGTALYTRPQPKREPLTNEQIKAGLIDSIDFADQRERCAFNIGVRFAERAHKIGGVA